MSKKSIILIALVLSTVSLIGCQSNSADQEIESQMQQEFDQKGTPGLETEYTGPNSENLPSTPGVPAIK